MECALDINRSRSPDQALPQLQDRELQQSPGWILRKLALTTPLEEVQRIYDDWCRSIPEMSPHQLGQVIRKTFIERFDGIIPFPTLGQEQARMATALGNWYLKEEGLKEAKHYYAIALNIDETQDHHRQASSVLIQWAIKTEVFKKRLALAEGKSDPDLFNSILDDLERAKRFCYRLEDFQELWEQAQDVLLASSKSRFDPCVRKLDGLRMRTPSVDYVTQAYRKAIQEYRKCFDTEVDDVQSFQDDLIVRFRRFFKILLDDAFVLLGPPPCELDLRAMGSWASKESCPYSDIELFLLIEPGNSEITARANRRYADNLVTLLDLQIALLGETAPQGIPVFTAQGKKHPSGLHLDNGHAENGGILIGSPDDLARELIANLDKAVSYQQDDPAAVQHLLMPLHSISISSMESGCSTLIAQYEQRFNEASVRDLIRAATSTMIASLQASYRQLKNPYPRVEFNIKDNFFMNISYMLRSISIYLDLGATGTMDIVDALEKRSIFTQPTANLVRQTLAEIYRIRVSSHGRHGQQQDTVTTKHLLPKQVAALEAGYWLVLRPLSQSIALILEGATVDLPLQAFRETRCEPSPIAACADSDIQDEGVQKLQLSSDTDPANNRGLVQDEQEPIKTPSDLRPLVTTFTEYLVRQGCTRDQYANHYRTIIDQFPLRQAFLSTLEQHKIDISPLAQLASKDGLRWAQLLEARRLQDKMAVITTPGVTDVKVTSPALPGPLYLRPEVRHAILDKDGNVKRGFDKCRHNVACFEKEGLFFKQKPSHPLMEYAVHTLSYRIGGMTTPPSVLARFEIEGRAYPVLISEAIPGSTIKEKLDSKLDQAQLTKNLLCAVLTKPGDGRGSNYVVDPSGRIFCIDNDVSFVEPVTRKYLLQWINFCSILFCLNQDYLDPAVLEDFARVDPDQILMAWIEDLIEKEKEYAALFSTEERDKLYKEDKDNRFTPSLLLREGAVASLWSQFHHLKEFVRQRLREGAVQLTAIELLREVITLGDHLAKTQVGSQLAQAYQSALKYPDLAKRLEKATSSSQTKSKTTPEVMRAALGKVPTIEEIERQRLYGPEMAKQELLSFSLWTTFGTHSIVSKQGRLALEAQFERLEDPARQESALAALQLRAKDQSGVLERVTIAHCRKLDHSTLQPFLNQALTYLDLRGCPLLTSKAIDQLTKMCSSLEELYLSGSGIDAIAKGRLLSWGPVKLQKLKTLHITHCANLKVINIFVPELSSLKTHHTPKLELEAITIEPELPYWTYFESVVAEKLSHRACTATLELLASTGATSLVVADSRLHRAFCSALGKPTVQRIIKECRAQPVTKLAFYRERLSTGSTKALAMALRENRSLKSLDVSSCSMYDDSAALLADGLNNTGCSLEELNLSCNNLVSGIGAIMRALTKRHPSVTKLDLHRTGLGDYGAGALAHALEQQGCIIKEINISECGIGDPGGVAIARSLSQNSSIQVLDLSRNHLGDQSAQAFADALTIAPNDPFGRGGMRSLDSSRNNPFLRLRPNQSLQRLTLTGNRFGVEGSEALRTCKNRRMQLTLWY